MLTLYRRGNLRLFSNFAIPYYESMFVRRVDVKIKNKTIILRSTDSGKYFLLYVCDYFARLWGYDTNDVITEIHDYDHKDRLERLLCVIPISPNIKYLEIGIAKEYENPEPYTYLFKNDRYCYFEADLDGVLEAVNSDPEFLETCFELQRKWDEMVRKA